MTHLGITLGSRDQADRLVGSGVPDDTTGSVVSAPTVVVSGAEPVAVIARYPADRLPALRQAMLGYPMDTTVRAAGIRNRSRVFGFGARNIVMQRNGCRACSGALDAPEAHAGIIAAAPVLAGLLADACPEIAARDQDAASDAIAEDWRLCGTQWTSGVLNRTSPMPYHYDRNNLEPVWSAMIVCRRGVDGGQLHVPELDVRFQCRDGDVVFFPGWKFVHGVTPLRVRQRDGYRLTAVYYAVRGMAKCLPADEEMARARAERTLREQDERPAGERLGPRPPGEQRRGGIPRNWRFKPSERYL